ncbi:MAG: hypothetical protein IPG50_35330 [Myxococcales bacterium]|nr:hypothetical protein [Myxococcales bacterium]
MSATELLLLSERLEAEAIDLERELRVVQHARDASAPKARGAAAATPALPASPLGTALARHAALGTRLRLIAPLIVAARAGREERSLEPSSLLERRPSTRGANDPAAVAELAARIDAQCDAVVSELERIGLARATGHWQERAHEALLVRTLLAETRYERAASKLAEARSPTRLPKVADLSGLESQADLVARLALLEAELARTPPMAAADEVDAARAVLAERWARYSDRVLALAPQQRATLGPLPELGDLGAREAIDRAIAAVSTALTRLPEAAASAADRRGASSAERVSPDVKRGQRDLRRAVSFLELVAGAFGALLFGLACLAVVNMLLPRPGQPNFVWNHASWSLPLAILLGVAALYATRRRTASSARVKSSPDLARVRAIDVVPVDADEEEHVEARRRTRL